MKYYKQSSGLELIPNYLFWKEIPDNIKVYNLK